MRFHLNTFVHCFDCICVIFIHLHLWLRLCVHTYLHPHLCVHVHSCTAVLLRAFILVTPMVTIVISVLFSSVGHSDWQAWSLKISFHLHCNTVNQSALQHCKAYFVLVTCNSLNTVRQHMDNQHDQENDAKYEQCIFKKALLNLQSICTYNSNCASSHLHIFFCVVFC